MNEESNVIDEGISCWIFNDFMANNYNNGVMPNLA